MNLFRGILMIAIGAFAIYRGWVMMHVGRSAWFAFGLGVLAVALGVWRLMQKPSVRVR